MANKINLLPPGINIGGSLGKILKLTRMLGVISVALFLIFALGISVYLIISTITMNGLNSETDSLKVQVKALESTEQQVVLLKDRIGKINIALAQPEALKNLDDVEPFISGLGPSTSLSQLDIDPQKVDLSLNFKSTLDTSTFIKSLSDSNTFKSIVLMSFGYYPTSGYSVSVSLTK